ncbi:HpcH/HpaI aldolase/citrate lyase family protein [Curtobacterium sp. MCPF17_052]|uniref:HpcH/HpaI aldolase/citrate lyase family protein n=1 Tax=Curtobacterium sp. MCPF17_052 TaxID=2175655 RepID=UPI0024DF3785|nr:HpcH/HpaI aldolase/citrate lyase family protein [Curtobacterium sp. MCPF17_052]WIB12726.1 HpcH/HpaI aldolase/citrate lyase family protein [Curtobacterium sp. MCPF17_052]
MRHFANIADQEPLFLRPPEDVTRESPQDLRAVALGATLYTPGIRPDLVRDVRRQTELGAGSIVLCLEDSVADDDLPAAEANVEAALRTLAEELDTATLPQLFLRVRTPEHFARLLDRFGSRALDVLAGIVLPKFEDPDGAGAAWFEVLDAANEGRAPGRRLLVMPILESPRDHAP